MLSIIVSTPSGSFKADRLYLFVLCLLNPIRKIFFLWIGTQKGHNVPFLEAASPKKRKIKAMKRTKEIYKIYKMGNKKISRHLFPKVVTDLPFEGREVEGNQKYRRRERVPKAGSRRRETITEPINSRTGEFHTIVVGKCCLPCGMWPSHWRWNTGG